MSDAAVESPREDVINTKTWNVDMTIRKYADEAAHARDEPFEIRKEPGNLLLNAGITRMLNLLGGVAVTAYNAANSRIGVSSTNTAAAASQTDLQGATKYFKLVDSVTISAQSIIFVATFGASQANFAWAEWVIDNGTADGSSGTAPALNRKVADNGTKVSPQVWVATATITVA